MLSSLKKPLRSGRKASLLIEVLAAVLVLSAGILIVMQGFATQRRIATTNRQKTRELFMMADHLGAVLAGATQDDFCKTHDEEQGSVKVTERQLDGEKEGLKEISLLFEGAGLSGKSGIMVLTYVKDDAAL